MQKSASKLSGIFIVSLGKVQNKEVKMNALHMFTYQIAEREWL